MKKEMCKWHNHPKLGCPECKKDLDKTSNFLNNIFNSPKFIKKANELFERETTAWQRLQANPKYQNKKATSPEIA